MGTWISWGFGSFFLTTSVGVSRTYLWWSFSSSSSSSSSSFSSSFSSSSFFSTPLHAAHHTTPHYTTPGPHRLSYGEPARRYVFCGPGPHRLSYGGPARRYVFCGPGQIFGNFSKSGKMATWPTSPFIWRASQTLRLLWTWPDFGKFLKIRKNGQFTREK